MKKIFIKKKKKDKNDPVVLKRAYIRLQIEFLLLFIILCCVVYFNYDYIIFKYLISTSYTYTDTLDEIYKDELNLEPEGKYLKSFDELAISLISDKITQTNNDIYTYLFLKDEYNKSLDEMDKEAEQSFFKVLDDKTAYISLTNFSPKSRSILFDNTDNLKEYDYIIIDLRNNGGGYLDDAYKISDLFLPKGDIICTEKSRNFLFSEQRKAKTAQKLSFKKIYILQNEYTASASEVMINALKENLDNVIIVGTASFGKGIGQAEFILKNHFAFKATVIELETPKGNSIHKKGITPDIEYDEENIIDYVLNEIIPNAD